ncbi:GNAT family N-acetyltransferase [Candidatus Enterococcus clewellii]|uniref:N-acetyltransferase domain-containing protein n=1 Tax=Candidatus Enterococcus clewellii TaxID=1834193 RepID=A0A242K5R1_9ENTE|nr:GNAT family N-acetyltransferase [Enterococcus sp. 9E7_DIV0242]OTP15651.1 hypothetical protein A5888_001865 [Enterococcus sp. 9E7_DIV0242]
MGLHFEKAMALDKEWLTEVMIVAFNFDTARHRTDTEEDGPPGYNDGTLAEKMLSTVGLTNYIIVADQQRIGCLSFCIEGMTGTVEKFCLFPEYIGQGFGTMAWQLIEKQVACKTWVLETPDYSVSNHQFYEKCGFRKKGKKRYAEDSHSIIFEKKCE